MHILIMQIDFYHYKTHTRLNGPRDGVKHIYTLFRPCSHTFLDSKLRYSYSQIRVITDHKLE